MELSDIKLLLHCNGSDTSTSFPDSSPSNHTVTAQDNAQVDIAQKKWGTGSGLFDGDGDHLSIPNSSDWDIPANFTIDLWQKINAWTTQISPYTQQYEDATNYWAFYLDELNDKIVRFVMRNTDGVLVDFFTGINAINDTNWHHVALCKVGNEWGIYVDGTQIAHVSDASMETFTGSLYICKQFIHYL